MSEKDKSYQICFFNEHNGYYPHNYEVVFTINDEEYKVCSGRL